MNDAPVFLRGRVAVRGDDRVVRAAERGMGWINLVLLVSGAFGAAVTAAFHLVFGFGWYALGAGAQAFLAASLLVPFFLGVWHRGQEGNEARGQRKPSPLPRGRRK